ncbi:Predicted protein [Taphrina deformans PYCC 5710]|uniref:Transcriptional regulatory protein DEP1 n=1 Tax=Taphrina deformans (strain PYCC 5710 / ATCC 11124 / CBS 356.35 / IMI 108563 / JCM 9778 / NBRC 8474) TaxID=1097556 RepID=R4XBM7_TAPDE|nr:Predicted protein [Taphrina deformans PYCC 5710]|eukprot:CCG83188.1 Predicted protein [Taphrina deformans PYCC 5710]
MPRRGSLSQSQSRTFQDDHTTKLLSTTEDQEVERKVDQMDFRESFDGPETSEAHSQKQAILNSSNNFQSNLAVSPNNDSTCPPIGEYGIHEAISGRPSIIDTVRVVEGLSYDGTGLSDDGRSLTPDPHSSEAETERIATSDEDVVPDENLTQDYPPLTGKLEHDLDDEIEEDDIPADLDALSDTGSFAGSAPSDRSDGHDMLDDNHNSDIEDGEVLEDPSMEDDEVQNDDSEQRDLGEELQRYEDQRPTSKVAKYGIFNPSIVPDTSMSDEEEDEEMHAVPDGAEDEPLDEYDQDRDNDELVPGANLVLSSDVMHTSTPSARDGTLSIVSSRKRTRSPEVSPGNTKRLAPRKVQAELDSDEEVEGSEVLNGNIVATGNLLGMKADLQNTELNTPDEDASNEHDLEAVSAPEALEEAEEEEIEEEVQDDTEREERNKHRHAAMEALRLIESEFTKLRAKLYDERMRQIDGEIALAECGAHPLIVEKTAQNQSRHNGRIRRAEILRARRLEEADKVFNACKFVAHSQFSQDRQKLRATLLSRTSAEWFQIHREKRVIDMAVPEYGYLVPDRRSIQVKHRREYEAEISILAGLKNFVGFPAAPSISTASGKDIDADLSEMGITKYNVRENSKQPHASRQQGSSHSHMSMTNHLNHHTHSAHTHAAHSTVHGKSHHRKPASSAKQRSAADKSDHHTQAHHVHPKNASPQLSSRPPFHTHPYQGEIPARKSDNSPALYSTSNEIERKPILHALNSDSKPLEPGRDKLAFAYITSKNKLKIYPTSCGRIVKI